MSRVDIDFDTPLDLPTLEVMLAAAMQAQDTYAEFQLEESRRHWALTANWISKLMYIAKGINPYGNDGWVVYLI